MQFQHYPLKKWPRGGSNDQWLRLDRAATILRTHHRM
jgi:hypothetical protein